MPSTEQRRKRVRSGSRRRRDLAVVEFSYSAFVAEHFPDEDPYAVHAAAYHFRAMHHGHYEPTPEQVHERMAELGWLREQRV